MKSAPKAEANYLRTLAAWEPLYPWLLGLSIVVGLVAIVIMVIDVFDRSPGLGGNPGGVLVLLAMTMGVSAWNQMQAVRILRRHGILPPRKKP